MVVDFEYFRSFLSILLSLLKTLSHVYDIVLNVLHFPSAIKVKYSSTWH